MIIPIVPIALVVSKDLETIRMTGTIGSFHMIVGTLGVVMVVARWRMVTLGISVILGIRGAILIIGMMGIVSTDLKWQSLLPQPLLPQRVLWSS